MVIWETDIQKVVDAEINVIQIQEDIECTIQGFIKYGNELNLGVKV